MYNLVIILIYQQIKMMIYNYDTSQSNDISDISDMSDIYEK